MMDKWINTRKELHKYPELSGKEKNTAEFIVEQLKEIGVEIISANFSQYSILAGVEGTGNGKTIMFRCELDALPIQENNNFAHVSQIPDVSHKCGHDGHMAIMLAFAEKLVQNKTAFNKVYLLFQSAEETGEGAQSVLESELLKNYSIDYVFALHNVPGFELGSILYKEGVFTPKVESVRISLNGQTSHAGQPSRGVNPTGAVVKIISFFNELYQPNQSEKGYFVVAPIFIKMGEESYGTTAGVAKIGYTIRSFDTTHFDEVKERLKTFLDELESEEKLETLLEWIEPFASNENNAAATQFIESAAKELNVPHKQLDKPFDWGEDFGIFTHEFKGAMFGLGAGEAHSELHHNTYDFPDELIEKGAAMFYQIVKEVK